MSLTDVPRDIYLVAKNQLHQEPENDAESFYFAISGDYYVKNMVTNVQKNLMDHER